MVGTKSLLQKYHLYHGIFLHKAMPRTFLVKKFKKRDGSPALPLPGSDNGTTVERIQGETRFVSVESKSYHMDHVYEEKHEVERCREFNENAEINEGTKISLFL